MPRGVRVETKYDTHIKPFLGKVEELAHKGVIEEEIARALGVGYSTYCKYKTENIELVEAIKRGKAAADIEVENALFKTAMGFEQEEEVLVNGVPTLRNKYYPPNVTAQIFWLKNRQSDKWKDVQKTESTINGSIEITGKDAALLARIDKRLNDSKEN